MKKPTEKEITKLYDKNYATPEIRDIVIRLVFFYEKLQAENAELLITRCIGIEEHI